MVSPQRNPAASSAALISLAYIVFKWSPWMLVSNFIQTSSPYRRRQSQGAVHYIRTDFVVAVTWRGSGLGGVALGVVQDVFSLHKLSKTINGPCPRETDGLALWAYIT